jgi:hypothetical protein
MLPAANNAAAAASGADADASVFCTAQLPYTEAVIIETMRLMCPGSLATRSTEEQGLMLTVSDTQKVRILC